MLYFLQSIDQFGVEQKLQIPPINPTQKSALGGLITLALYGVSLGYFLFQFIDWQTNNKLPKITSLYQQIDANQTIVQSGVFIEISYYQKLNNQIDPFNPKQLIFNPIFQLVPNNWDELSNLTLRFEQEQSESGKIINKFFIDDIEIIKSQPAQSQISSREYQLLLGYCRQDQLIQGHQCADEETINQFYDQENYFQVQLYIEQFNPKTKQFKKVPKFFIFDMMPGSLFQNQFTLQAGELELDDGFFLPKNTKYSYLSDVQIIQTTYDWPYSRKVYGEELISLLFFTLDQIKLVNNVEYPKISEILADTGSIIQWILSISFLVSKYNENICLQKAQREIISMYYHDFTDFQINKNWLSKIKSVNFKGREYDPSKSEEILNRLNRMAVEKMNYLNLQNEVAKLQLILQEHLGLQQIKKYLETKYKLEHLFDKLCIPEKNIQSTNQILPSDNQYIRNQQQQLSSETDILHQKEITLDQEFDERIYLLVSKNIRKLLPSSPPNQENQDSSQNINLQVMNLEQSQSYLK
ncbi:unnamed protein product (macronuclear) [Paramecium tetraurelia]|uniref:Uncharacterized protein n=1 Tax=Paramecium tetraurelia TaxID=5888 RepID=A0E406_PARTE|nr:uncharacterized protein GSPATT00023196001 [Paramecium tetraurelia]CAK90023.1 unnamed protein product [Paramecium tetraurelia]|eukprot:XP_001457420.1 hypothetical protein (macronuclear) [Paramecium tetraurelia strain d4-2]